MAAPSDCYETVENMSFPEDEHALAAVFKNSFPESWQENPDFTMYLQELSSYGREKLAREPDRLSEERAAILEQTQDLTFHNYKTFIHTAECSKDIYKDFTLVEQHLESVMKKLPSFKESCSTFMKTAQEINQSRRMNSLTLSRHAQLLEILEMPQLMDTCVRNGYYEEALELAAYVKRLEKRHAAIPVIVSIVGEVKASMNLMLNHLIQQLRTNVQLPACLKVIGYLRRMDAFTEAELRIKFLQARDAWFQSVLSSIRSEDPYHHITKTIELSRVHLFDIITQYRAIFSDEDPLLSTTRDSSLSESAIFYGWVHQKVQQFLQTLVRDLSQGVSSRLDSVIGQCMYFGLSFSRVGADFRPLMAPLFQEAALRGFQQAAEDAARRFDEAMQSYTLLNTSAALVSNILGGAGGSGGGGETALQPPSSLLECQPMAVYCNQVLTAFNELRLCAPVSIAADIATALQGSLVKVADSILAYHRAEESAMTDRERERFAIMCGTFACDLVPYLSTCLHTVYPVATLAQLLGVSIHELADMGNIGSLDQELIAEPLQRFIASHMSDSGITFITPETDAAPAETPGDEVSAETPGDEVSAETPADEASAETPGDEASAETPGDEESAETPGDEVSAETPGDEASAETPGDEVSAETPGDEAPVETPSDKAPTETPGGEASAERTGDKALAETPGGNDVEVSAETPAGKNVPAEITGSNESVGETPSGNKASTETPGGNDTPAEAPGGNEVAAETSGGSEDSAETPGGNEVAAETPGGNEDSAETPGGNEASAETPGGNDASASSETPGGNDSAPSETPGGNDASAETPVGHDESAPAVTPGGDAGSTASDNAHEQPPL